MLQGTIRFHFQEHSRRVFQEKAETKSLPTLCRTAGFKEIEGVDLSQKNTVMYYLGLSVAGAIILIVIPIFGSWDNKNMVFFDYLMVAGAFITSCLLGLSFALKPNWIKRAVEKRKGTENANPKEHSKVTRLGHHPDCREFEYHVIKMQKRTICSGCTGLAVGLIISIIMMIVYLFLKPSFQSYILTFLIIMGFIFIALNYIVVINLKKNSFVHMISNALLVLGFFLIVISIFEITGNSILAILAVIISFLWMDTRIQISKMLHNATCRSCTKSCKAYGI